MIAVSRASRALNAHLRASAILFAAAFVCSATACAVPQASAPSPTRYDARALVSSGWEDRVGALIIHANPGPDWVLGTDEGVWVANVEPGLVRYDADGKATPSAPTQFIGSSMRAAFGSLWAVSYEPHELLRVDLDDPATFDRMPIPDAAADESSVGITEGAVWVLADAAGERTLLRIDPDALSIASTEPVAREVAALEGCGGSLWISRTDGSVERRDGSTGALLGTVEVEGELRFMACGAGSLWVMDQSAGDVVRVDPERGDLGARIHLDDEGLEGGDIVAADDSVWVRSQAQLLAVIDPASDTVVARIGAPAGSGGIGLTADSVWASAHDIKKVLAIPREAVMQKWTP